MIQGPWGQGHCAQLPGPLPRLFWEGGLGRVHEANYV